MRCLAPPSFVSMKETSMSTRTTARKSPIIPARTELTPISKSEFDYEMTIERGLLVDVVVADNRFHHGMIDKSRLDGVTVAGANADGIIVRHTELTRCDWSNTSVESSSWSDTIFDGCKLTGTVFNRAVFKNVELIDIRADLAQFQHAKFQGVRFENCNLQHAFFNGAKLPKTVFAGCDLTGVDFSGATITGSDLRRSKIDGIKIGPEQLKGVIVTQDQALYLAGLSGLVVRD